MKVKEIIVTCSRASSIILPAMVAIHNGKEHVPICITNLILPLSLKASIPRIRASQTCLTLTNFIEKSINMYNIK